LLIGDLPEHTKCSLIHKDAHLFGLIMIGMMCT